MPSDLLHRLIVEFSTEDAFRSEYTSNIANGGIFIATREPLSLRQVVLIELYLAYRDEHLELEGEIVHLIPPEMADAGGTPGVAIQFNCTSRELREKLQDFAGPLEGNERISRSGRRVAQRSPARVRAVLDSATLAPYEGRTRDISGSGALVAVVGEPLPVGEAIVLRLVQPLSAESMEIDGKVVRLLQAESCEITAMGI